MTTPVNNNISTTKQSQQRYFQTNETYSKKDRCFVVEYTDGRRTNAIPLTNDACDPVGMVLCILRTASNENSPNMTKSEYKEALDFVRVEQHQDCIVYPETRDLFIEKTKPFIAKDSDGGAEITVSEMMSIADELYIDKMHEKQNKPWYKFW